MIKLSIHSNRTVPFYQVDSTYYTTSNTGAVQWNGAAKCFEVSTVSGWSRIDNTVILQMSSEFEEMMTWVKEKMQEEQKLKQLSDKYPAIKSAKEHLDTVIALVKEGERNVLS